ncbi:fuculose phosphate aldolase [Halarchaeum grantii]|uniref:Fuculose phosphate aldolase n=1 Tax=Halarchaeum grantii TaxID=1193105 RepID=A0A830EYL9_9EURY|nr:class II aldolase/adducin family protein [Halarchaeum grantii]GGL44807.1 fuculose phosphate aldolase [Halarchaeum grantii]
MTTTLPHADVREEIAEYGVELLEQGLTEGTGGNLSARVDDDHLAISPTGIPYGDVEPSSVSVVDFDGTVAEGGEPSSELAMHSQIYEERDDVGGVVHTHSPYATGFAVANEPIPASHYLVSYAGDRIPVADYETYGTPALGQRAVEALGDDYDACLLKNHGVIAVGDSLGRAFEVALMVEYCARVHHHASVVGEPTHLSESEMADAKAKIDDYGQHT